MAVTTHEAIVSDYSRELHPFGFSKGTIVEGYIRRLHLVPHVFQPDLGIQVDGEEAEQKLLGSGKEVKLLAPPPGWREGVDDWEEEEAEVAAALLGSHGDGGELEEEDDDVDRDLLEVRGKLVWKCGFLGGSCWEVVDLGGKGWRGTALE